MVKAFPNTSFLPVPKSAPAGHTTAAAHLLWQVFPRYPCLEYKDYSGQSCPVRYTWTASFGRRLMFWQKWFYLTPQFVAYQFPGHLLHLHWYFTAYSSICQVLLGALSQFFLRTKGGACKNWSAAPGCRYPNWRRARSALANLDGCPCSSSAVSAAGSASLTQPLTAPCFVRWTRSLFVP